MGKSKIHVISEFECLKEVQLAMAQDRFGLRNFVLGISAMKMNHVEDSSSN